MTADRAESPGAPAPRRSDRLLGVASLVANLMLSFEEPHPGMLLGAAVLVLAAPVGMLLHLSATSELTPDEKRRWATGLTTRQGPALFAAYFSAAERSRASRLLGQGDQDRP